VLGGIISPIDGIGPSDLAIDQLVERIEQGEAREVILALSTTMEGETTCYYLYKRINSYGIKISTIARGVGFGDQLEYTDELTLGRSIENRQPFNPS
jgi:recombination protein RecR